MRYRNLVVLGVVLVVTTAAFAGPRLHRGPTAPKLFKTRTPSPKPKATALAKPERTGPTDAAEARAVEGSFAGEAAVAETMPVGEAAAPGNR